MKKSFLLLAAISFLISNQLYADQTPIEQKIEDQTPPQVKEERVPEVIQKKELNVQNPMEKAAGGVDGAAAPAEKAPKAKKKGREAASFWPEDDSKLKLEYTDEAEKNESFKNFREEFLKRLAAKDKGYVLSSTDKGLKFLTGGYNDFKNFYSLEMDAKRSTIWADISRVLKMGGVFTPDGEFCAPYVYCHWPEGVRTNGLVAVVKDNVDLKKSASASSETVGTVGYEIVKAPANSGLSSGGWTRIETKDGRKGYVPGDAIRSPQDFRAWFKEKNGKWVMTTYNNGDF